MTKKIKLPKSGYTIEIKDAIGIHLFRKYQQIIMKESEVDMTGLNAKNPVPEIKIGLNVVFEGQDFILENILIALYDKEGNKLEPAIDKFKDLPTVDGNLVYAEVDRLVKEASMSDIEKKSG